MWLCRCPPSSNPDSTLLQCIPKEPRALNPASKCAVWKKLGEHHGSTPNSKIPQITSSRDYKALNRGTLGGLGNCCFRLSLPFPSACCRFLLAATQQQAVEELARHPFEDLRWPGCQTPNLNGTSWFDIYIYIHIYIYAYIHTCIYIYI